MRLGQRQREFLTWVAKDPGVEAMLVFKHTTLRRNKRECVAFVGRLRDLGLVEMQGRIRRPYQRRDGWANETAYSGVVITQAGLDALAAPAEPSSGSRKG